MVFYFDSYCSRLGVGTCVVHPFLAIATQKRERSGVRRKIKTQKIHNQFIDITKLFCMMNHIKVQEVFMKYYRFHHQLIGLVIAFASISAVLTGCGSDNAKEQNIEVESTENEEIEQLQNDENIVIPVADDSTYTITNAGYYYVAGTAHNFTVKVETEKEEKVHIALENASITNDDFPVIYIKSAEKCVIDVAGTNQLEVTSAYRADGDINTDAVIFSKEDLKLKGNGALTITSSYGNGITSKDDLEITGGTYQIQAAKHGLEANDSIHIEDGSLQIDAKEGMEATYVVIDGGTIQIEASDDGINATKKSDKYDVLIEVNGGNITIVAGPGDTDGLDSNGNIIVNGGTIDVSGQSTFDYDGEAIFTGGEIIINGTKVDEIPQSMMGGPGGGGFDRPGRDDDFDKPGRDDNFDKPPHDRFW